MMTGEVLIKRQEAGNWIKFFPHLVLLCANRAGWVCLWIFSLFHAETSTFIFLCLVDVGRWKSIHHFNQAYLILNLYIIHFNFATKNHDCFTGLLCGCLYHYNFHDVGILLLPTCVQINVQMCTIQQKNVHPPQQATAGSVQAQSEQQLKQC